MNVLGYATPTVPWWHTSPLAPVAPNQTDPAVAWDAGQYLSAQIAINPSTPSVVLSAGKAGVWATKTGQQTTAANIVWRPALSGLGSTVENDVTVLPADPGNSRPNDQVAVADTDWRVISSPDRLDGTKPNNILNPRPQVPIDGGGSETAGSPGAQVQFDPFPANGAITAGSLYAAGGSTNAGGSDPRWFASRANPFVMGSAWNVDAAPAGPVVDGYDLIGLLVGRDNSNTASVSIAAVSNCFLPECSSLYRRVGAGAWGPVTVPDNLFNSNAANHASLGWQTSPAGNASIYVYVYEPKKGLYCSNDRGVTWAKILSAPTGQSYGSGYMAVDPRPGVSVVYLSTTSGVYRISQAYLCAPCSLPDPLPVEATSPALVSPGPLAVDASGVLWATQGSEAGVSETGSNVALYRTTSVGTSPTLRAVSGYDYASRALKPTAIAVGS